METDDAAGPSSSGWRYAPGEPQDGLYDYMDLDEDETQPSPTPSSRPSYAAMPEIPQKRHLDPRGLLLGTWKGSGLHADRANAVYGSRDVKNRINRRISKESPLGRVVVSGNYNHKKTACKHKDIDYLPKYQGMTNDEVNLYIMPLLAAGGGAYVNVPVQTQTPRGSQAFAVRGARFFGSNTSFRDRKTTWKMPRIKELVGSGHVDRSELKPCDDDNQVGAVYESTATGQGEPCDSAVHGEGFFWCRHQFDFQLVADISK